MPSSSEKAQTISLTHLAVQAFLTCAVFAMWTSPVIQPVKIMVVLFHEMSHGLAALATGGEIMTITVTRDEGGLCETEGGIVAMIVSAGYLGSMFFGGMLLYLSKFRSYVPVVYTILTLVLVAAIVTVIRDSFTRAFATGLAATFIVLGLVAPSFISGLVLRVIGTISCLYTIYDIYGDVLATSSSSPALENDAKVFADITGIPPNVVGFLWLGISIVFFFFVLRFLLLRGDDEDDE